MLAEAPSTINVRYELGHVQLSGAVNQRVKITAQALIQRLMERVGNRSIDLICIAAGIYAMDRVVKRSKSASNESGIRTFVVCFHVADLEYWRRQTVTNQLTEILHFLTGDYWLISVAPHARDENRRHQGILSLANAARPSRVALYSGGLDSAAGLACQLLRGHRDLLLLSVGHQSTIRRGCVDQVRELRHILPQAASLYHASFVIHLDHAETMRRQEQTQRARGFLFCTSAAIVASACGIRDIDVFENGPGAINLPLVSGALSDGLATRGAHPAFLLKISEFVSQALGSEIAFHLPFIEQTKASMIAELISTPFLTSWVQKSRSCVHSSWREPGITHCGVCPACIERRQAFLAAGVVDAFTRYSKDVFLLDDPLEDDYLRSYLDDALAWKRGKRGDSAVRKRLDEHRILSDLGHLPIDKMDALLRKHASEKLAVYGNLIDGASLAPSANSEWRAVA